MVRTPSCDKSGLRKGTWTPEEDRKLIAYVTKYGTWNWRQLPKFAGLQRCGKSCRLRWMNYLRPNVKRGNFTPEEEECIIRMHKQLGNRWSAIAAELPGRTDNEIKNHWHTTLKKRSQQNKGTTEEPRTKELASNNALTVTLPVTSSSDNSSSDSLSPLSSSSEFSPLSSGVSSAATMENLVIEDYELGFLDSYNESFWKELNLDDISYNVSEDTNGAFQSSLSPHQSSSESMVVDQGFSGIFDAYAEATVVDNFWTQPYVADLSHVSSELLVVPSVEESEYFPTVYDDLWGQSDLYHESVSLF